jgi:hypothetical protein
VNRGLVASPLGLVVGLALGALGSGGSIIAVPALVYAAGQSPQDATATSLLLVGAAAVSGLKSHFAAGRVRVRTGVVFGLIGIAGAVAGSILNRRLDPDLLLLAFSGLIFIAAWRMLTACPSCTRVGEAHQLDGASAATGAGGGARAMAAMVAAATAVGFLTGLFGVGGGFLIIPALTLLLGFAMPQAIGTSLLIIAINSATGLLARLETAHIDWAVAVPFTVTAVIGVQLGCRLAGRLDPERSLRYFAAGLVVLALYTAGSAIAGLR